MQKQSIYIKEEDNVYHQKIYIGEPVKENTIFSKKAALPPMGQKVLLGNDAHYKMPTYKKRRFQDISRQGFRDGFGDDNNKGFLDDRGITLPTVIITAVLALAASAAGVIIYNTVRGRAESLNTTADIVAAVREDFNNIPEVKRGNIAQSDRLANEQFEGDEPMVAVTGDGISDVLYLATNVCPNLETRHWHSTVSNKKDSDPAKLLYPLQQATRISGIPIANPSDPAQPSNLNPAFLNLALEDVNQNWIEADGSTVILSPKIESDKCSYKGTADYIQKRVDLSSHTTFRFSIGSPTSPVTDARYYRSNVGENIEYSSLSPLRYGDCLRSGLAHVSTTETDTCELHFASSTVPSSVPAARANTASVGASKRANWHLISYCAINGGAIAFTPVAHDASSTYETTDFNQCLVNQEGSLRSCSASGLGLQDPENSITFAGFSVSNANSRCIITQTGLGSWPSNSVSISGAISITAANFTQYTPLPAPASATACVPWQEEAGMTPLTATKSSGKCVYTTLGTASSQYCAGLGLVLDGTSCAYTVKTPNPECPEIFKVNIRTGMAQCEEPLGTVSSQWEKVCLGWANTGSIMHDHDNDDADNDNVKDGSTTNEAASADVADDGASVYAYYEARTKTYRCAFKNRYTNGARECLSFGYQPGAAGECEVVGRRSYNPRPYAPTCAVTRATPYHTSQEQLFSITSLNLSYRNKKALGARFRNAMNILFTFPLQNKINETTPSNVPDHNDFFYDKDNSVLPNINNQLDYYYDRLIGPAIESYIPPLSQTPRYTELWLPSQFSTGNVSLSRTFAEDKYPDVFDIEDEDEDNAIDFIYSRRSPNILDNCDDYKQYYYPIHIEKSSASANEYTVGYNDQNKSIVCGTSAENFWEPRYYLDVITSGTTYNGSYCASSTTACTGAQTVNSQTTNLYRECGLTGTDTAFTRPAEEVSSATGFDYANSDETGYRTHSMNTYIKECRDIGYSRGDTGLYDYKVLPRGSDGQIRVSLVLEPSSANQGGTVGISSQNAKGGFLPITIFGSDPAPTRILPILSPTLIRPASNIRIYIYPSISGGVLSGGTQKVDQIKWYDMWVRSDARETRINNGAGPFFYIFSEAGLNWTRYGISEMLNYVDTRTLTNTSGDSTVRSAVLKFANDDNFGARDFSTVNTNFTNVPFNPAMSGSTNTKAGYFGGNGWTNSRAYPEAVGTGTAQNPQHPIGTRSNLTRYSPYGEQKCEFRVPTTASSQVQAFFRACQQLGTYFPTRFSYHKPIEVKTFASADVTFPADGSLPDSGNFGHWRSGLLTENGGAKHPSLIKYGDTSYNPPTYFHLETDRDNGYFYCEANPGRSTEAGVITASRKIGTTASNADCQMLNDALVGANGSASSPGDTTFEQISKMSGSRERATASDLGFVGHKEGPHDYYHCKWRAPFIGNPLAR